MSFLESRPYQAFQSLSADLIKFSGKYLTSIDKEKKEIANRIQAFYLAMEEVMAKVASDQDCVKLELWQQKAMNAIQAADAVDKQAEYNLMEKELREAYNELYKINPKKYKETFDKSILKNGNK